MGWPACARAALAAALLLGACADGGGPGRPAEEAAALAGFALARPPQPGGPLLLCGRFEVTASEFAGRPLIPGEADLPAVGMTRGEAASWAARQGLRLPTFAEWTHLAGGASGGRAPKYPWGPTFKPWAANTLRLGLHRPTPVGTFVSGRNTIGAFDFGGNVWEWVADAPFDAPGGVACGGSFANYEDAAVVSAAPRAGEESGPPWSFLDNVRVMNPADRAEDVGFRCVADAAGWMRARASGLWEGGAADREALRRAFLTWPSDLRARLAASLESASLPPGLLAALRDPGP